MTTVTIFCDGCSNSAKFEVRAGTTEIAGLRIEHHPRCEFLQAVREGRGKALQRQSFLTLVRPSKPVAKRQKART